ncbi:mechanosensitive ion channel family protein [Rhizobium paknamense]|uniref:Small-conductance mechanosensitive channel n=1 Tax=Rhizobium paknamense TaxID=1206817 RepID=A0ABU0I9P4_9HYPH|nr:mechanosensitive ion channel domain-containing protein [Rhizobium paknamense]MDQ0454190.1 small conductance mechanosensitive channel [Rhizobium paknamense]
MDEQASEFILATRTALAQLGALAVQYSFSVVGAILLLLGGWYLSNLLQRLSYDGMRRIRGFDETLTRFFSTALRYAVLILVFITVLGQFGVQTASIIAALGAAGLAIGLALQGTLQNIAAGIMLLVLRPFRVGEYIDTGSVAGTVVEIGLFATQLKTADGVYRLAPNSTLWNVPITNFSREPTRRNEITLRISYRDDLNIAEHLLGTLLKDGRVLTTPQAEIFIADLGESSVGLTLRYWTAAGDFWAVNCDFMKRIRRDFEANGLHAPYPHLALETMNGFWSGQDERSKTEKAPRDKTLNS